MGGQECAAYHPADGPIVPVDDSDTPLLVQ